MIKNIIFDIGNVILHFDIDEVVTNYTDDEEKRNFIKNYIYLSPEWTGLGLIDLGYIDLEEAASQINDRTNHIHEDLVKDFLFNYMKFAYIDERVVKLMYSLKENEYKIYILSNMSKGIGDQLHIEKLLNDIDGYILSYEYHQIKPYKSIYETLINKYNINPSESIFIDDRDENIRTANTFGIKGHNVEKNSYESIIDLLKEYNIVR